MQFNLYKQIIRIKWNYAITPLSHRLCTRHVYIFHSIRLNIRMIIYFTRNIRISFKEEVLYTLGILSIHVRGKLEARMTWQRVEFLLYRRNDDARTALIQLAASTHAAIVLQPCSMWRVIRKIFTLLTSWLPPEHADDVSTLDDSLLATRVYDAGHTWSCTRIIRITFTRVCSPERNG